jgi:predicted P-loop ATPase
MDESREVTTVTTDQEQTATTPVTEEPTVYTNWMDGLERTKSGVKQTIQNAMYALQYAPELHGILRYNEFTGKTEVSTDGWKRYTTSISDLDLDHIRYVMERGKITKDAAIMSAVNLEAHRRAYHPVKDVLTALKWDGKDHISELLPKYLGAERCEYTTVVTKMIFSGVIHRIMRPGTKYDFMPILVDTAQGGGKSTLVRFIAMSDTWYTTIKHLDDPDKVVETLSGHLVIEMEELEGLITAKSIETVRAFLSRSMDTYRTPYAKYSQDIPRQSICIGTSNDPSCLPQDRAGNRRFLPVRCNKDKAERHPLDNEDETRNEVMQCYAQAMHLYEQNELPAKLPAEWEKRLPEEQRDFLPEDIKAGQIQKWIEDNDTEDGYYCVAMIYQKALDNIGLPKIWESKEIGAILDGLKDDNGEKLLERYTGAGSIHRFDEYGRQRAWVKRKTCSQCSQTTVTEPPSVNSSVNSFRPITTEEIPFP